MTNPITTTEVQAYLRLDSDEEAAIIAGLIAAARAHVEGLCGMVLSGDGVVVPAALRQAMLMLVGHWYAAREATAETRLEPVPHGVKALIAPYRRLRV